MSTVDRRKRAHRMASGGQQQQHQPSKIVADAFGCLASPGGGTLDFVKKLSCMPERVGGSSGGGSVQVVTRGKMPENVKPIAFMGNRDPFVGKRRRVDNTVTVLKDHVHRFNETDDDNQFGKATPEGIVSLFSQTERPTNGLKGFVNTGNTCYMNAVLSCLLRLPHFADAVMSTSRLFSIKGVSEGLIPFLAKCVQGIATGGAVGLRPESIKDEISKRKSTFLGNAQQDAHEFMINLMELIHGEILKVGLTGDKVKRKGTEVVEIGGVGESSSLVRRLTEGILSKNFICAICDDSETVVREGFCVLSVPVKNELLSGLDTIFKEEIVERTCSKCSGAESVAKVGLDTLPHYFFIHLNRFRYTSGVSQKITTPMTLPPSLDLTPHCPATYDSSPLEAVSFSSSGSLRPRRPLNPNLTHPTPHYALVSVINHLGETASSGHYTTRLKDASGEWYDADDAEVTKAQTPAGVASETCYIAVYERVPEKP